MRYVALSLVLALSSPALADNAPPPTAMKVALVRGMVESVDATTLKIKSDAGGEIVAPITPNTRFAYVVPKTFEELKPSDFVGITAVPGRNGHLRAEEIHILPAVGIGEGQYPWDHHPSTSHEMAAGSMTNGSILRAAVHPADSMTNGSITSTAGDSELTVTYKGAEMVNGQCEGRADPTKPGCTGSATVDVGPTTAIVAIVNGTIADAKAGLAVVAFVVDDGKGHTALGSATFEKNGVKPEF